MGIDVSSTGVPDFDKLETVKISTATVSTNGSPTNWTTIPHGLSYIPIVIGFLNNVSLSGIATNGNIPLPTYTNLTVNTTDDRVYFATWVHVMADDTNVYIVLFNSLGTTFDFNIKYYLLRERQA